MFYVYEHWRPDTNACFYVGKGKGQRAYTFRQRGRRYGYVFRKLRRLGLSVEVTVVASGLSEAEALDLEKRRIAFWRESGVNLANGTDGGEGTAGLKWSQASREKLSEVAKRRMTPEARRRLSEKLKGRKLAGAALDNFKAAMARTAGLKRRPHSAATRKKLSLAAQNRKPVSDSTREKHRAARVGRKWSPEVKAKMSAAAHKRYGTTPTT